jgi:hypothetical protein
MITFRIRVTAIFIAEYMSGYFEGQQDTFTKSYRLEFILDGMRSIPYDILKVLEGQAVLAIIRKEKDSFNIKELIDVSIDHLILYSLGDTNRFEVYTGQSNEYDSYTI